MSKPIVWADLPVRKPTGHEQHGRRPCILVQDLAAIQPLRFPMLLVVPLTTSYEGAPPLYVKLSARSGGLPKDCTALLDQTMCLDPSRVVGYLGTLSEAEYQPIGDGLRRMLNT